MDDLTNIHPPRRLKDPKGFLIFETIFDKRFPDLTSAKRLEVFDTLLKKVSIDTSVMYSSLNKSFVSLS